VAELYAKPLIDEGTISEADYDAMKADFRKRLEEDFDASDNYKPNKADWLDGRWSGLKATKDDDDPRRGKTGVNVDRLKTLGKQITAVPDGFNIHRTAQARHGRPGQGDLRRRKPRLGHSGVAGIRLAAG
jgi:2-oxoglutarate dehydrogenase E1 component